MGMSDCETGFNDFLWIQKVDFCMVYSLDNQSEAQFRLPLSLACQEGAFPLPDVLFEARTTDRTPLSSIICVVYFDPFRMAALFHKRTIKYK
jgi:hypothetical protein